MEVLLLFIGCIRNILNTGFTQIKIIPIISGRGDKKKVIPCLIHTHDKRKKPTKPLSLPIMNTHKVDFYLFFLMREKCFFSCGSFGNFLISVFPWKSTLEGHWKTRGSVFSEQAEKVKAVCKCLPWWTLGSNKEAHKKAYKYPAYLPFLGIFPGIRGWMYSQRLDREEYTRAASPAAPLPLHHVQNYPSISTASGKLFPCCDHVAVVRWLQPTLVFIRLLGTTWPSQHQASSSYNTADFTFSKQLLHPLAEAQHYPGMASHHIWWLEKPGDLWDYRRME